MWCPLGRWDWEGLRKRVVASGARNSLLLAPMPTASTAQILGYNECIEPYTSNLYARRVKAGDFIVANPHLLKELVSRGMWDDKARQQLLADNGSVQVRRKGWDIHAFVKIDKFPMSESKSLISDRQIHDSIVHKFNWC